MKSKSRMKHLVLPLVVFILGVGILLATRRYEVTVQTKNLSPTETVQAFYKWYTEFKGHPLLSHAYKRLPYLHPDFVSGLGTKISVLGNDIYENDPILCAGRNLYTYDVSNPQGDEYETTVMVTADFYGNIKNIEITLLKERGIWTIYQVKCLQD